MLSVTWKEVVIHAGWGLVFPFREPGSCRDASGPAHLHPGTNTQTKTFPQKHFQPLFPRGPLPWLFYLFFFPPMSPQQAFWEWESVIAGSLALQASLVAQMVKGLPAMQETQVQCLGQEDPLEKEMATHSSILALRIPWTEEPGGPQPMGSQRVRHDWATNTVSLQHQGAELAHEDTRVLNVSEALFAVSMEPVRRTRH